MGSAINLTADIVEDWLHHASVPARAIPRPELVRAWKTWHETFTSPARHSGSSSETIIDRLEAQPKRLAGKHAIAAASGMLPAQTLLLSGENLMGWRCTLIRWMSPDIFDATVVLCDAQ